MCVNESLLMKTKSNFSQIPPSPRADPNNKRIRILRANPSPYLMRNVWALKNVCFKPYIAFDSKLNVMWYYEQYLLPQDILFIKYWTLEDMHLNNCRHFSFQQRTAPPKLKQLYTTASWGVTANFLWNIRVPSGKQQISLVSPHSILQRRLRSTFLPIHIWKLSCPGQRNQFILCT